MWQWVAVLVYAVGAKGTQAVRILGAGVECRGRVARVEETGAVVNAETGAGVLTVARQGRTALVAEDTATGGGQRIRTAITKETGARLATAVTKETAAIVYTQIGSRLAAVTKETAAIGATEWGRTISAGQTRSVVTGRAIAGIKQTAIVYA